MEQKAVTLKNSIPSQRLILLGVTCLWLICLTSLSLFTFQFLILNHFKGGVVQVEYLSVLFALVMVSAVVLCLAGGYDKS